MTTVRKRAWETNGVAKEAWIVDYRDRTGKRRIKTCPTKKAADNFARALNTVAGHVPESLSRHGAIEFIAPLPRGKRQPGRVAIADAFRAKFPDRSPTTGTIGIQVFAEVPPAIAVADVDNLLKPVLDALSGVAYFDDTQISECLVRRIPSKERRLLIRIWSVPTELLVRGLPSSPMLA